MKDSYFSVFKDIGTWNTYSSYRNKEQLKIQRDSLSFSGLENQFGDISFIFTKVIADLLEYLNSLEK